MMMHKKKIGHAKGKVSADTVKKGASAMGKAMSAQVISPTSSKQKTSRKAKHL